MLRAGKRIPARIRRPDRISAPLEMCKEIWAELKQIGGI